MADGHREKERHGAHDEDADRGDRVQPDSILFIRPRSQHKNRDQAVAVARREPDGARGAHPVDVDDHATDQDVLMDRSSAVSTHW